MIERPRALGESGMSLLELVMAVPLLAAMFASLALLLFLLLRMYFYSLSDWELLAEIRRSSASIAEDVSYAEALALDDDGRKLHIYTFGCNGVENIGVEYQWKKGENPRIMKDGQPMTGGSRLGNIWITEFWGRRLESDLLQLHIKGKNMLTEHEYTVETVVQLYDGEIAEHF